MLPRHLKISCAISFHATQALLVQKRFHIKTCNLLWTEEEPMTLCNHIEMEISCDNFSITISLKILWHSIQHLNKTYRRRNSIQFFFLREQNSCFIWANRGDEVSNVTNVTQIFIFWPMCHDYPLLYEHNTSMLKARESFWGESNRHGSTFSFFWVLSTSGQFQFISSTLTLHRHGQDRFNPLVYSEFFSFNRNIWVRRKAPVRQWHVDSWLFAIVIIYTGNSI